MIENAHFRYIYYVYLWFLAFHCCIPFICTKYIFEILTIWRSSTCIDTICKQPEIMPFKCAVLFLLYAIVYNYSFLSPISSNLLLPLFYSLCLNKPYSIFPTDDFRVKPRGTKKHLRCLFG